jgi:ribonuclease Z
MNKIIMLGTGNGGTVNFYNTCFLIQNDCGNFLIDTGGGVELIKRLRAFNLNPVDIKNIFISHAHTDHILGIFWFFKKIGNFLLNGEITEKINVYCNDIVYEAILQVASCILPNKLIQNVFAAVNFIIVKDRDRHTICNVEYEFFDLKGRGTKQFGFEATFDDKKFIFLGDETLNPLLYNKVRNSDYVAHEAFCLDEEEYIFHAYQKNHSTVKSVSEIMNILNVKTLILYHTEESHGTDKKRLYTKEAQQYFHGRVIVPNDLEIIEIT